MHQGNYGGLPTWEILIGLFLVVSVLVTGFLVKEAIQYVF
tara:strand:+ start:225 stop:344 length:120 start_codon:yes stop_codon:yes gene_type:complete